MRMTAGILAALVLLAASPAARGDAASAAWKKYKGQIIVSDGPIPGYSSDRDMIDGLRKLNKTTLTKKADAEAWAFSFMGFLSKKVSPGPINLVFYKVSGGKREYMSNKEINVDSESNIVQADIEVSEEDNITAGNKYDVVLGRMANGRETVYARTKLTFVEAK